MQHVNLNPKMEKYLNRRHDNQAQRDQERAINIETAKLLTQMFRKFPGKVKHSSNCISVELELADKRCIRVTLAYGLSEDGYNLVMGWTSMIGNFVEQNSIEFNMMRSDMFQCPVDSINIGSLYAILRAQYDLWSTK
ncbi:hypothetical protein EBPL_00178 [Enterobacter phage EBPL]|uniref:Uncharacterized protein n=1 Tax=Enterobacter phage EBPL TaxID=2729191 RepID=A0A6M3YMT1_9CAUD|nr:hypothetical protein EBPL_00178 [Enterobacter phage EBPL]